MLSQKSKGLTNRLKEKYPHLIAMHDFSHAFNLIAQDSIAQFPSQIVPLVKSVSKHFSRSSLRRAKFRESQTQINEQELMQTLLIPPHVGVLF